MTDESNINTMAIGLKFDNHPYNPSFIHICCNLFFLEMLFNGILQPILPLKKHQRDHRGK